MRDRKDLGQPEEHRQRGVLYLVSTPIGNLEDITLRALRVLREASLIAAEDTRTARKLLTRYAIGTPLTSFHEFSRPARIEELLERLMEQDVAVISEAGTPGIADPGFPLVREAIQRGIRVVPIPGPSALLAALAASGLPCQSFVFLGFLPQRARARRELLATLAGESRTLVAYEAPHRLLASLRDLLETLGDRRLAIGREMTKLHEEIWRGPASEALDYFEAKGPRGEFTLVVSGATNASEPAPWSADVVRKALNEARERGLSPREASKEISRLSGWARRDVYRLGVNDNELDSNV